MTVVQTWVQAQSTTVQAIALIGFLCLVGYQIVNGIRRTRAARNRPIPPGFKWHEISAGARIVRMTVGTLIIPGIFSVYLLLSLFGGRHQVYNGQPKDLLLEFVSYLLGSGLIGTILGIGYPLILWSRVTAAFVGSIALVPVTVGMSLADGTSPTQWTAGDVIPAAVIILVFGTGLGLGIRRRILRLQQASSDQI